MSPGLQRVRHGHLYLLYLNWEFVELEGFCGIETCLTELLKLLLNCFLKIGLPVLLNREGRKE